MFGIKCGDEWFVDMSNIGMKRSVLWSVNKEDAFRFDKKSSAIIAKTVIGDTNAEIVEMN